MKKTLYLIAILTSLSAVTIAQGRLYNTVRTGAIDLGYKIGQEWNAPLKQGDYFTHTFNFEGGIQYDIIALSEDGDVLDVDLQVLSEDGEVYKQDVTTDRFAEVTFYPTYDRTLTLKVKNYKSNTPYYASKVYFMIAYRN